MLVLMTLWSTAAHAQLPPGLSLGAPRGDVRWVTQQVDAQRFPASAANKTAGPSLKVGDEVELVVVEGNRARIKKGDRFGWVPLASLTETAPASASLPGLGGDLLGQPLLAPPSMEAPPDLGAGMGGGK